MARSRILPTYRVLAIIGTIFISKSGERRGSEIMDLLHLPSSKVYPAPHALKGVGIVSSRKRKGERYIYYRLRKKGKKFAEMYRTGALARNPPLVPLDEFK